MEAGHCRGQRHEVGHPRPVASRPKWIEVLIFILVAKPVKHPMLHVCQVGHGPLFTVR